MFARIITIAIILLVAIILAILGLSIHRGEQKLKKYFLFWKK